MPIPSKEECLEKGLLADLMQYYPQTAAKLIKEIEKYINKEDVTKTSTINKS